MNILGGQNTESFKFIFVICWTIKYIKIYTIILSSNLYTKNKYTQIVNGWFILQTKPAISNDWLRLNQGGIKKYLIIIFITLLKVESTQSLLCIAFRVDISTTMS